MDTVGRVGMEGYKKTQVGDLVRRVRAGRRGGCGVVWVGDRQVINGG